MTCVVSGCVTGHAVARVYRPMDDVCIAADADYCNCACIVIAGAARKSQ